VSDGDIPKSSADFVLKFVWGTIVFALGFEGIVKLVEGELRTAVWCFVAAAVLSLALVHRVKIAAFMRSNMFAILIALGFAGALALGIAIGGLVGRNGPLAQRPSTAGRIAWSFDQPTANYSLAMSRLNNEEVRIVGFQAHGKNTSPDPITEFTRAMRSDRTNEERPILFLAQETAKEGAPPFGIPAMVPTLPVETYGIPGLADFDVATHESPFIENRQGWRSVVSICQRFRRLHRCSQIRQHYCRTTFFG
jgi:hypothetical protein